MGKEVLFCICKECFDPDDKSLATWVERVFTSPLYSECEYEWRDKGYTSPEFMISVYEREKDGCDLWVAEIDMSVVQEIDA